MEEVTATTIGLPRNAGITLASVWLVGSGSVPLLELGSPVVSALLNLLAITAGALLLWERHSAEFRDDAEKQDLNRPTPSMSR